MRNPYLFLQLVMHSTRECIFNAIIAELYYNSKFLTLFKSDAFL